MFTTYFTYKPDHEERHYLVNTRSKKYAFICDRIDDSANSKAQKFTTSKEAEIAIDKRLKKMSYGQDGGYFYTAHIVDLTTSEDKMIWKN